MISAAMATVKRTLEEDVDHRRFSRELSEKICLGFAEKTVKMYSDKRKATPVCHRK